MTKSVNDHVEWLEAAAKQAGVVDYSKTVGISSDLPPVLPPQTSSDNGCQ